MHKKQEENQNGYVKIFKKNSICLGDFLTEKSGQKTSDAMLEKIGLALKNLSSSQVYEPKLAIGGQYHKKQYNALKLGFCGKKNDIICLKNAKICDFGMLVKQNMCNYGIYFYEKHKKFFAKIFCGNGFLLEQTQQNFVEKFFNSI